MVNSILAVALAAAFAGTAPPTLAQTAEDTALVYRREVYSYPGRVRPDPFRSLLKNANLGTRFENLSLRGVIYNEDARLSVAVFAEAGNPRRIRARVGQKVGGMTVLSIQPRRVEVRVEEFGIARREALELKQESNRGTES